MIRSPFFYVGDKYKLMPQLLSLFPKNIETYFEPFLGGGTSMLNVDAKFYKLNDLDPHIVELHNFLLDYKFNKESFFKHLFRLIKEYNLSCSFKYDIVPSALKKEFPKTYYAKFNKSKYTKLKNDYNKEGEKDNFKLYLLLIYGFNHMIRFNKHGDFNLPVGNVDFNKNVYDALNNYFDRLSNKIISLECKDYKDFIKTILPNSNDFIYFDPPYLISMSEYNKFWNKKDEKELYEILDQLNNKGIKFGITNLIKHKGKTNKIFESFSKKYKTKVIQSNYISYNDNTIKTKSIELYVYNY